LQLSGRLRLPASYKLHRGFCDVHSLTRLGTKTRSGQSPLLSEVLKTNKVVNGTTYTTSYGYNLAGELTSVTYPSQRVVTQSYDAIGRLSTIASGGTNYASNYTYNAAFQVTGLVTSPSFCTSCSERVYITAMGCEIGLGGTRGLQATGAGGL
jgi:YD repeat-containing protein